ncbi:fumarate hydratase, class II [Enterococcus sp. AZ194]|uniref:class II fumarate hydratase n=1 Tax=Enterococcus sp. AZ194 TaxID=2774629 RepID=UPI003F21CB99
MTYRTEKDSMGEIQVPIEALWGPQTQRSKENFVIGQEKMPIALIEALVLVKQTAAVANQEVEKLSLEKSQAIYEAAQKLLDHPETLMTHFPLSVWQTGSGTQTNMNANEVIAHHAGQKLAIHPNDDVNCSQSSNDVFPTAIQIAAVTSVTNRLLPTIERVSEQLEKLEETYQKTIKIGRTHLQDATPITFAQEVSGWRASLQHTKQMIELTLTEVKQLPIGGTAVGTGLNASSSYVSAFMQQLNKKTGLEFVELDNKFYGLANKDALVFLSGALKALAANSMKMANDVRWLASGPRSGFGEITLPANEPGSSIMPGKVNPTQCEALTMVAVQVMGNDTAIGIAASQGNFELNVYMPLLAYNLLQSIELLTDSLASFEEKCLRGLTVNEEKMAEYVNQSLMLVTALNAHIGYDKGAEIAKHAFNEKLTLKQASLDLGYVTEKEYDSWVKPERMLGENA